MTFTPRVSIVVPVFDAEATIEACVESLLAQDYPGDRLEIVLVDNASRDGTPEILRRYSRVARVVYEARRGAAAARNRGVREATGEVIAFTDADCEAERGWVRHLVGPLESSEVGVAGGRILAKRPCNRVEAFGEEIHDHEKALTLYRPPYAITMSWASPKGLLESVGLFDEAFLRCQDADLAYRIFAGGARFAFVPDAVVYHRNERTLAGLFREGYQHGFHSVRVIKKHRTMLEELGHRRVSLRSYTRIAADVRDYLAGRDPDRALCSSVFNVGKKAGKLAGSIRFGRFES